MYRREITIKNSCKPKNKRGILVKIRHYISDSINSDSINIHTCKLLSTTKQPEPHHNTCTHARIRTPSSCIVTVLHSPLKHVLLIDGEVLINNGAKSSKNFVENGYESLDSLGPDFGGVIHHNHALKTRLNHWLVFQQVS